MTVVGGTFMWSLVEIELLGPVGDPVFCLSGSVGVGTGVSSNHVAAMGCET